MVEATKKAPLISLIGTTATGKTGSALAFARKIIDEKKYVGVDVISADSRQVFSDLAILSGADVPQGFEKQQSDAFLYPFFASDSAQTIRLHGLCMLSANEEWSVALFKQFALAIIAKSLAEHRLPILVGGTGLYHQHVTGLDPTLFVVPDSQWRKEAALLSVVELQQRLQELAPQKYAALNNSDKHNPRRLQRAIEIAQSPTPQIPGWQKSLLQKLEHHFIGITVSASELSERIKKRVEARIAAGVLEEVQALTQLGVDETQAVQSTLGLHEIQKYLAGESTKSELYEQWILAELQYAKRQETWWKKHPSVHWTYSAEEAVAMLLSFTK